MEKPDLDSAWSARRLAEQAFSRAAGAPLVAGNRVSLLKDAAANYPLWLAAIRSARRTVHFENYIFEEDPVGEEFAQALSERAQAGVKVRLVRDWMGSRRGASRAFWRRMADAGVELRWFNPPRWHSPFGWFTRDHRKMIAVDGQVAFVSGLCVSQRWLGDPVRGVEPWRDTGVELAGPAVAYVERAFAQVWAEIGPPIPPGELAAPEAIPRAGEIDLRVVAGAPNSAGLFRLDQLIAVAARKTLWLTDAYFVGVAPYIQALRAAAKDGVDVRLLLPNATDLPLIQPLSRAGYRGLLEAGVRVFEWNGSMLHAKTAVADGRWARVGSSNLNWASFVGNYELDVQIEDDGFAHEMEEMYEEDLAHSTEIVLTARKRVRPTAVPPAGAGVAGAAALSASGVAVPTTSASSGTLPSASGFFSITGSGGGGGGPAARRRRVRLKGGSGKTVAAGAIRVANAMGAAVSNRRTLGQTENRAAPVLVLILLALTAVSVLWPRGVAYTFGALAAWLALAVTLRVIGDRADRRRKRKQHAKSSTAAAAGASVPDAGKA